MRDAEADRVDIDDQGPAHPETNAERVPVANRPACAPADTLDRVVGFAVGVGLPVRPADNEPVEVPDSIRAS
jgi:hypothetical protein